MANMDNEQANQLAIPKTPERGLDRSTEAYSRGFLDSVKNYLVDTSASILFTTPTMAASEYFLAGMDSGEVFRSRLYAVALSTVVSRPFGRFRQAYADWVGIDANSSPAQKYVSELSASTIWSIPVYSTILYLSGSSFDEIAKALPAGLSLGVVMARPYGYFLDTWRKFWGTKPTLL